MRSQVDMQCNTVVKDMQRGHKSIICIVDKIIKGYAVIKRC